MNKQLLSVSLRKNAIAITHEIPVMGQYKEPNETTLVLLANCTKLGYNFSQELLQALNFVSPRAKLEILETLKEVTGVHKNWTPLVKQWNIPTGELVYDHIVTFLGNVLKTNRGTKLPCGHYIPDNTFPLERYNGCPFCGSQFEFEALDFEPTKGKFKTLELWRQDDLERYMIDLLQSPVALDATQVEDLKVLISHFSIPEGIQFGMKETLMLVIDQLVNENRDIEAGKLFKSPTDILRYLWYKHTGFLQIIEPKTIVNRMTRNANNWHRFLDQSTQVRINTLNDLKLKFNRSECRRYASWMNGLTMKITDQCEAMHPKRGIWVRVIRALRLAEYSKRKGFERLAELLDVFYNEAYEVWQGKVNAFKLKADPDKTFELLKQRPGLFARSLFSTMLWFGPELTISHFVQVMDKIPQRLIFTLNMYAEIYFDRTASRTVKPLGGTNKRIPSNSLLSLYSDESLEKMKRMVQDLSLEVIKSNLQKVKNDNKTIYIDESLYRIPIAIGDRVENIQDLPGALMGTRFKVEGDTVRLFMQWGEGLRAQHLDMDLSCKVAYEHKIDFCSYSQLNIAGCKHSGDIQHIPHMVGTAEYIDIDLNTLNSLGAKYVSFTCNAYTSGNLAPNLVIGWMNSKYPMKITSGGVAYNPTDVQHQVRVTKTLTKGMVFGVLDVANREIVWLEMGFGGQVVQNLSLKTVESLINKLDAKLKIGDLLELKANIQGLTKVPFADIADEVYDAQWALNTAEVSKLFLG